MLGRSTAGFSLAARRRGARIKVRYGTGTTHSERGFAFSDDHLPWATAASSNSKCKRVSGRLGNWYGRSQREHTPELTSVALIAIYSPTSQNPSPLSCPATVVPATQRGTIRPGYSQPWRVGHWVSYPRKVPTGPFHRRGEEVPSRPTATHALSSLPMRLAYTVTTFHTTPCLIEYE